MNRILLVEDDKSIIENLSAFLKDEGFMVESTSTQNEALEMVENSNFDLVLLDISLAQGNGFAVCSGIKSSKDIPVIFLTASGDEYSVVAGLDMGADDYINKPFRPRELISRIKSVLRRYGKTPSSMEEGGIRLDPVKGTVQKNGKEIFLSALEYKLLLIFFNNRGKVLTRNALLDEIWDVSGDFVNDNTLTVYIKRLREKIEDDPQKPAVIKTVRGLGYKLGR